MLAFTLALLILGDAPPAAPELAGRVAPGIDGAVELVLIGDTGEPGPLVARWSRALAKEPAQAIVVLGDLVYPQAPPCRAGVPDLAARRILDSHVAAPFAATGKETFLVLGNHDISWVPGDPARDDCIVARFARDPQVRLPAKHYAVDLGVALLVVFDTNALDEAQAVFAREVIAAHGGGKRVVFAGHHVVRTYHDKDDEDDIYPWLVAHRLRPDIWVNGHAHILQMVVRDGLPAVTSGSASRPRERPSCDRAAGTGQCGELELWGRSTPGYAVLRVGRDQRMAVTFKDADGAALWRWDEPRKVPGAP